MMKKATIATLVIAGVALSVPASDPDIIACGTALTEGIRPIAQDRADRFLGKVLPSRTTCRGGELAYSQSDTPWTDWGNYWSTRGEDSLSTDDSWLSFLGGYLSKDDRGMLGSLIDLEYQRVELLKFNLFDNETRQTYVEGDGDISGRNITVWPEMRLTESSRYFDVVGGDGPQLCTGDLIRFRTDTGICNDIKNPAMGASGKPFGRNIQFEETYPTLSESDLVRNRHGDRLALMAPDPQVLSRILHARQQSQPELCNAGYGLPDFDVAAHCDYKPAPFFNVIAAFWIQFMTHDWFSHLNTDARNSPVQLPMGCRDVLDQNRERPLTPAEVEALGCRPADTMEQALYAETGPAPTFTYDGKTQVTRTPKTTTNFNTAWWDASQIYGYDRNSVDRAKRDPRDPAKLLLIDVDNSGRTEARNEYLPVFNTCEAGLAGCTPDPISPEWRGQEAAAFPDNWTIGMSFLTTVFAREHNSFVDAFRARMQETPRADSGLRHPDAPDQPIAYEDVSDDELYGLGRLVVSAMIAKIHTIEWTPQLLYNEPLYRAMNSNWSGVLADYDKLKGATEVVADYFRRDTDIESSNGIYSVLSSGTGIIGTGAMKRDWSVANPDDVNGGVNHFGVPFNFPEEFISVYRLHPLVPDLLEYRDLDGDPNQIIKKIPVVETFRHKATPVMQDFGMNNMAVTMGRQRLGLLSLQNHPAFLQNLHMPVRLANTETQTLDVVALDIRRDRERGTTRYNEFRRQFGLKQVRSFDDFIDQRLLNKPDRTATEEAELADQQKLVTLLREMYGTHVCDNSKVISLAQVDPLGITVPGRGDRTYPTDCLGHPDGSVVDNIEDLDLVVGMIAETTRPHGFAISETQFQVFILNASRRLFSDRFFTSSYRPEFYSTLGLKWVNNNGPDGTVMEAEQDNGHEVEVSPLKRVLLRAMPELAPELDGVMNAFDPWARDRGSYYALDWTPKPRAANDPAFAAPAAASLPQTDTQAQVSTQAQIDTLAAQ